MVSFVGAITAWFAIAYVSAHEHLYHLRPLHAFTALFILGMQGVLLSTAPITFLFFWEVMSLSSFFLVFADHKTESIKAAMLYLIMTHLGAGAILAGFMLLTQGSLVTTFLTLSGSADLSSTRLAGAFILFLFGFGSKAGLWPFHVWLPEAHPQAPSHISALMSGVMLKIALYGFLRVLLTLLPSIPFWASILIIVLGLLSAVYGVLYAVVERDIKRLLAYSSMENLGLIFTMIGVMTLAESSGELKLASVTMTAVLLHAWAHALFKSGLFMGAGVLIAKAHSRSLEAMGGLAKRLPTFAGCMLVLALGAGALPPFSGFIGEWIFLQELVSSLDRFDVTVSAILVVVLATFAFVGGLAVFAMVKMFGIAFLAEPRTDAIREVKALEPGLTPPIILMAVLTTGFGLFTISPFAFRGQPLGFLLPMRDGTAFYLSALIFLGIAFLVVFVLRRLFSKYGHERSYHSWDCGQPITPRMEYTATAFSGPVRFFFHQLLQTSKHLETVPVVKTNPWIASKIFRIDIRRFWFDFVYIPIGKAILQFSTFVRRIQNGVIQFYIALILVALVLTIVFLV